MSRSERLRNLLSLDCDVATEFASRELDKSLPRLERVALAGHILLCTSCRRFRKQIRFLRRALQRRAELAVTDTRGGALSNEARARIGRMIRDAAADGSDGPRVP